jgi:hypothetical protein
MCVCSVQYSVVGVLVYSNSYHAHTTAQDFWCGRESFCNWADSTQSYSSFIGAFMTDLNFQTSGDENLGGDSESKITYLISEGVTPSENYFVVQVRERV